MTAKTGDITTTRHTSIGSDIRHETVVSGNYLVLDSDQDIVVTGQVAPVTITLPAALVAGRAITVRDEGGFAIAFPITVSGNGNLLNGAATQTLLTASAMLSIVGGSTQWSGAFANGGPVSASFTQLTGAGPFAMSSTPTDTIGIDPSGNDAVLNLPSLATVPTGRCVTIENNGTGIDGITPTGSAVLLRNGADTIGKAASFSRLYPGGSVQLQANVAASRWEILGFTPGSGDIVNFVDTVAGIDTNPGTALLPLKTMAGVSAVLPNATTKGLCRATITGTPFPVDFVDGTWFAPSPDGFFAEPLTLIGLFVDSGLGIRTSTGVSVLAGAAGILVTDSSLAIGADAFQGFRFRATSGAASGLYAAVATNTALGAFTLLTWQLPGFVVGDKFVIEQPATTLTTPNDAWRIQGPNAIGFYGLKLSWDGQFSNGARIAMESCWGGLRRGYGNVTCVLGNLRAGFNTLGIGSRVGKFETTGVDTYGACTLTTSFGPIGFVNCVVFGSFVSLGIGPTWNVGVGSTVWLTASWGGTMFIDGNSVLLMFATVRHKSPGINLRSRSFGQISNCDFTGGTGLTVSNRSHCNGYGLIGTGITGIAAVNISTASRVSLDAASTLTGSAPGVNDLNIGLAGLKSHAALTAAVNGTITDYAIAGGTGVSASRGAE